MARSIKQTVLQALNDENLMPSRFFDGPEQGDLSVHFLHGKRRACLEIYADTGHLVAGVLEYTPDIVPEMYEAIGLEYLPAMVSTVRDALYR